MVYIEPSALFGVVYRSIYSTVHNRVCVWNSCVMRTLTSNCSPSTPYPKHTTRLYVGEKNWYLVKKKRKYYSLCSPPKNINKIFKRRVSIMKNALKLHLSLKVSYPKFEISLTRFIKLI